MSSIPLPSRASPPQTPSTRRPAAETENANSESYKKGDRVRVKADQSRIGVVHDVYEKSRTVWIDFENGEYDSRMPFDDIELWPQLPPKASDARRRLIKNPVSRHDSLLCSNAPKCGCDPATNHLIWTGFICLAIFSSIALTAALCCCKPPQVEAANEASDSSSVSSDLEKQSTPQVLARENEAPGLASAVKAEEEP